MKRLTKEQKREIAAIAAKKDEDIDLSEMPEVIDWSDAEVGKFYRPSKRPVTMRLARRRGRMAEELRARLSDEGQHASETRDEQHPGKPGKRQTAPGIVPWRIRAAQ